jgi:hypothetical protein
MTKTKNETPKCDYTCVAQSIGFDVSFEGKGIGNAYRGNQRIEQTVPVASFEAIGTIAFGSFSWDSIITLKMFSMVMCDFSRLTDKSTKGVRDGSRFDPSCHIREFELQAVGSVLPPQGSTLLVALMRCWALFAAILGVRRGPEDGRSRGGSHRFGAAGSGHAFAGLPLRGERVEGCARALVRFRGDRGKRDFFSLNLVWNYEAKRGVRCAPLVLWRRGLGVFGWATASRLQMQVHAELGGLNHWQFCQVSAVGDGQHQGLLRRADSAPSCLLRNICSS